jgi:hypothetical protein
MRRAELETLVASHIRDYRRSAARELEYFRVLRSDEDAVAEAALGRLPSGKRHDHQRRVKPGALKESRDRHVGNLSVLRSAASFDTLFELVDEIIRPIRGIGDLAVYDTAERIGARLRLEPERVYLHRGARDGAKALGLDGTRDIINHDELPPPLRALSAREVEDFLCIYKRELRAAGLSAR